MIRMNKNLYLIKRITLISILTALSLIFYIIGPKFPLPFCPLFLEINFSVLPILIGLFILGYKEALLITLLRFIIKLPFTSTVYVGEITDLILSSIVVSGTYFSMKLFEYNNKFIYISIFLSWIVGGIISNIFALPAYIHIAGFSKEMIISLMPIFLNVTNSNLIWKYFILCVIPFNIIISIINILIIIPIYKRLKYLTKMFDFDK